MDDDFIEIPFDAEEPSEQEIRDYAEWLGADLSTDQDLFYISREALLAPPPKDWKIYQKKNSPGEIFYFNKKTGESSWDHPLDQYYKELFFKEKQKKVEESKKQKIHY